jgi:dipicolinate synthase subunit A
MHHICEDRNFILSFFQDRRLRAIAPMLIGNGYGLGIAGCTLPAGMPDGIVLCPNPREWIPRAGIVLLPLPAVRENLTVAFSEEDIPINAVLSRMQRGSILLGGMLPRNVIREAEEKGITAYDYYAAEEVMLKNADLTAEAALYIAMQELSCALFGARVAVVGCGRIGNALCRMLRSLGVSVTALARREASLSTAASYGCETEQITVDALCALQSGYDVVYNTVPSRIFSEEVLQPALRSRHGEKTLYVDLASSPGGFDPVAARKAGIHLLWALSLPGKYAPDSAGQVLGEQMLKLLREGDRE